MKDLKRYSAQAGVATVGAASATVAVYDGDAIGGSISADLVGVEGTLIGRRTDGTTKAVIIKVYAAVYNGVLLQSAVAHVVGDAALLGCVGAVDVSASKIRLRATGVAGEDLTWFGRINVLNDEVA